MNWKAINEALLKIREEATKEALERIEQRRKEMKKNE